MGIQSVPVLIVGWVLSTEKVMDFLIKNKVGTCDGYYDDYNPNFVPDKKKINGLKEGRQCPCGSYCWENMPEICKDLNIVFVSPYYDCEPEACNVYLSLLPEKGTDVSMDDIFKLVENKELVERARKLAIELSDDDTVSFKIISVVDIS